MLLFDVFNDNVFYNIVSYIRWQFKKSGNFRILSRIRKLHIIAQWIEKQDTFYLSKAV